MDVARLQADPVHRRQMADRIALMRMLDELRLRRRARGEVQQIRIGRRSLRLPERIPATRRRPQRYASQPSRAPPTAMRSDRHLDVVELRQSPLPSTITCCTPPSAMRSRRSAARKLRGRGQHDRAELHRARASCPTVRRGSAASAGCGRRAPTPRRADDSPRAPSARSSARTSSASRCRFRRRSKRGRVVVARHRIEIIERPVEAIEHRPAEFAVRACRSRCDGADRKSRRVDKSVGRVHRVSMSFFWR